MKKTKLRSLGFGKAEQLTRSQLKSVIGGVTPVGQCYYSCTYYLNGVVQRIHAWGSSCTSSSQCTSETTCGSYGDGPNTWGSTSYCAVVSSE